MTIPSLGKKKKLSLWRTAKFLHIRLFEKSQHAQNSYLEFLLTLSIYSMKYSFLNPFPASWQLPHCNMVTGYKSNSKPAPFCINSLKMLLANYLNNTSLLNQNLLRNTESCHQINEIHFNHRFPNQAPALFRFFVNWWNVPHIPVQKCAFLRFKFKRLKWQGLTHRGSRRLLATARE